MERFTATVRAQPEMEILRQLLLRILDSRDLHARFVNTLSRMEYIGVRKMLKARRAQELDEAGLLHIIEEASHALRLKRAAVQLSGDGGSAVRTYSESHTLAGEAGEEYMQGVDHDCETLIAALGADSGIGGNYLLSTTAIEIRAEAFYPIYEECLQATGAPFSVKSILKDELRHLAEMGESLAEVFPGEWEDLVAQAVQKESESFRRWLDAMTAAADQEALVVD
ncbi:MAG: hypothetical protein ACI9F9_001977 [Candidatus Paceibacteria bacterium]|jgi:hypothetical protein